MRIYDDEIGVNVWRVKLVYVFWLVLKDEYWSTYEMIRLFSSNSSAKQGEIWNSYL